jgi:pectate lyase
MTTTVSLGLYSQAQDYSVNQDDTKNQAVLTLKDKGVKYYNTADLTDISFDGNRVTVNVPGGSFTYNGNVSNIAFVKATNSGGGDEPGGGEGDIVNPEGAVQLTEARGWQESAFVTFNLLDGAKSYHVYVKGGQYSDYTKIDDQLVRNYGSYGRADVVGLKAGTYSMKVVAVNANGEEVASTANEATGMQVRNYPREGFAFMGGYMPGAYNSDGTLKSGAKVFYVTKNTAKTITTTVVTTNKGGTTECTGLQAIIAGYEKGFDTTPITFRFIGLVTKNDLDAVGSKEEGIQVKGKKADSEMNMTFEGIGNDATIKGFGFLVRNAKGVEFRNIGIMRCLDDGLSLDTDNSNIWIHHNDFFYGPNGGGDHAKGDGSCDVKSDSKYVTVSYNRFWDTGKTNMFGMKSESGPNYISYDHNWFDHSDSRHPRVRTMSVHVWNNFFDNVAKYGVGATSGASVFVENNYFLKTKKPILSSLQGTDGLGSGTFSGEDGGMIKAYGNYFDRTAAHFSYYTQKNPSAKGYDAYETATRDEQVPATEKTLVGGTTYNNFDTDGALMYSYTADAAADVPGIVKGFYGAGRLEHGDFTYTFSDNVGNDNTDSAYDAVLGGLLDNYQSTLVGIFGDESSSSGDQPGGGDEPGGGDQPGGGDEPGGGEVSGETIVCSFDGAPSNAMFSVGGSYGDGKITYEGTYYKKGAKLDSKGSVTFTPTQNYNMTLVLATGKTGRDVKLNGEKTTVGGTENTEGAYYEMEPIAITKGTQYVITKGSAESLLMIIKLVPITE